MVGRARRIAPARKARDRGGVRNDARERQADVVLDIVPAAQAAAPELREEDRRDAAQMASSVAKASVIRGSGEIHGAIAAR